jgi:hypothetical protein
MRRKFSFTEVTQLKERREGEKEGGGDYPHFEAPNELTDLNTDNQWILTSQKYTQDVISLWAGDVAHCLTSAKS